MSNNFDDVQDIVTEKQAEHSVESILIDAPGEFEEELFSEIADAHFQELEVSSEYTENDISTVNKSEPSVKVRHSQAPNNIQVRIKKAQPDFDLNAVDFEAYMSLMGVFEVYNEGKEIDSLGESLIALPLKNNQIYFPRTLVKMNPLFVDDVFKVFGSANNVDSMKLQPVMVDDEVFSSWAKETYTEHFRRNLAKEGVTKEEETAATKSWLTKILSTAVQNSCSDVHIYLREETVIKFRARKKIQEHMTLREKASDGRRLFNTIINDLGSKRGSGRMNYVDFEGTAFPFPVYVDKNNREQKTVELRIEKAPIDGGLVQESAALYIRISRNDEPATLEELNVPSGLAQLYREAMQQPMGLILVTGPTGSGKTALLHGILREMPEGLAARTIEDPVELRASYNDNIAQMSVTKDRFQEALESVLRQDPDVIMLGEVRDKHMFETLMKGTMSGHLTLSTLHTNGTIPTLKRLIDMGASAADLAAEQFLSLLIATRLNKLPCQKCALGYDDLIGIQKVTVDKFLGVEDVHLKGNLRFINTKSENCSCTRGEVGMKTMQEVISVDDTVRDFIRAENWVGLREHLIGFGWKDFEAQARSLIIDGTLDLFEVKHVIAINDKQMNYSSLYQ